MKTRTNGEGAGPTLEELLEFASAASLSELVWEKEGRRIAFKRPLAASLPEPVVSSESAPLSPPSHELKKHFVKSPMVGTFLRAPKGRPPMIVEGDEVAPGHRLGVVEAMQVPKDVIASVKGRVIKVLVENGRPVEYGQPIFEIEQTEGA
jgi:acetyl-CoA carboxylase biotin carboxyl carrier protein